MPIGTAVTLAEGGRSQWLQNQWPSFGSPARSPRPHAGAASASNPTPSSPARTARRCAAGSARQKNRAGQAAARRPRARQICISFGTPRSGPTPHRIGRAAVGVGDEGEEARVEKDPGLRTTVKSPALSSSSSRSTRARKAALKRSGRPAAGRTRRDRDEGSSGVSP